MTDFFVNFPKFIIPSMVSFTATIHKFEQQGEKSGWSYIEIPGDLAQKLKPANKKSFRVKGRLDQYAISGVSLLPMGDGNFILPINGEMRRGTGKKHGALLKVQLEEDKKEYQVNAEFIECLSDEPKALANFKALPRSHQNYYSKWIDSAKTEPTRTRRIAAAVSSLAAGADFSQMLRSLKKS